MKKLLVVLMMLLSLCACSSKQEESKKLIVGFDADFPPYGYVNENGEYDGFDLALAKEACSRIGYEFEAVAIDWSSKDAELASGNINCIWNGFTMNGREDDYTFSDAYVDNSIVVVVKSTSGINSLSDLAGKKVMVQAASTGADALYADEELYASLDEVIELADYNLGFLELDQNTVDAIVIDYGVAVYQLATRDGLYTILDVAISKEQYAVGFLKGNTELRDVINEQLLAMAEDGTMLEIAKEYEDLGLSIDALCLIK